MNTPTSPPTGTDSAPRRLVRSKDDRMIAGVASGIAAYFDVDVTVVRISIAVLSVFGGAGVALYIAGWLLMPEAGSDSRSPRASPASSRRACSHERSAATDRGAGSHRAIHCTSKDGSRDRSRAGCGS